MKTDIYRDISDAMTLYDQTEAVNLSDRCQYPTTLPIIVSVQCHRSVESSVGEVSKLEMKLVETEVSWKSKKMDQDDVRPINRRRLEDRVMKLYAVDGTEEELNCLRNLCLEKGWDFKLAIGFGRKRKEYPVQKVMDAYCQGKSIRAISRMFSLSPGSVQRIVRHEGSIGALSVD